MSKRTEDSGLRTKHAPEPVGGWLVYIGDGVPAGGGALCLEEGWSAVDHEEPDAAVYARKVASGAYAPGVKQEVRDGDSAA